jgi:hypothetical protein
MRIELLFDRFKLFVDHCDDQSWSRVQRPSARRAFSYQA